MVSWGRAARAAAPSAPIPFPPRSREVSCRQVPEPGGEIINSFAELIDGGLVTQRLRPLIHRAGKLNLWPQLWPQKDQLRISTLLKTGQNIIQIRPSDAVKPRCGMHA